MQVMVSYSKPGRSAIHRQEVGDDALLGMIHSFADRKTTEEAIQTICMRLRRPLTKSSVLAQFQNGEHRKHFSEWKKA